MRVVNRWRRKESSLFFVHTSGCQRSVTQKAAAKVIKGKPEDRRHKK